VPIDLSPIDCYICGRFSRTKAINRVLETLKRDRVSFERSFAALRAEEKRRQLEKERVKWLAEDRRPFTQVEQDLISRVLRGRANEVLASGFNTELTRYCQLLIFFALMHFACQSLEHRFYSERI